MRSFGTVNISRRSILSSAAAFVFGVSVGDVRAVEVVREISELAPGEFTWHPDRQPTGPVAIVVSIPQQRVHVYRNGVRIAAATCSTGKPGHETPTGVFVILEKDRHHKSSTYSNAPMPNMNRLTWSGIALHAGNLPGYPASHGCVRLPLDFSDKLFGVTHVGTPVIIAGSHSDPWEITHPGMVLAGYAESEFAQVERSLSGKKHAADWTEAEAYPVTSVIASTADRRIMMLENSETVATGRLTISGDGPIGDHVFVLNGTSSGRKGMRWTAVSHSPASGSLLQPEERALARLTADSAFLSQMNSRLHPGMVMIVTDVPLEPAARTGKDFVIMSVT